MNSEEKWFWKMDYCKQQHIPPAEKWAWDLAEKEFIFKRNKNKAFLNLKGGANGKFNI